MTDVNKLFETGLHKLPHRNLILLADQQDILLHKVETANLVYLIQELAFRLSDHLEIKDFDKSF